MVIAEVVRVARDALVGLHHRRVRLRRAPRIVAALAGLVGSAESLLDVGAHDGRVALALGDAIGARRVEGVDVQRFDDAQNPRDDCTTAVRLPFDDGAFDVVVLFGRPAPRRGAARRPRRRRCASRVFASR